MLNTRPTRWYHKVFYRWSSPYRHDVERGNRWFYSLGYSKGQQDAMQHMPWPYEVPHTDPLQSATPKRATVPLAKNGDYVRFVRQQEGGIHTQLMRAIGKVQLAQLQANMRAQEHEREERNG